jgi:type VI secretion system secreted protein VgrG
MKTCNCNYWAKLLAVTLTVPQLKGAFKMKSKRLILSALVALAGFLPQSNASLVPLGSAGDFAVLAGAGITVAGAVNTTTITGNIGTFPTTSITGLGVVLNGVNHAGDGVTQGAKGDLLIAYNDAAGRSPTAPTYGGGFDLVGQILTSGVYHDDSSLFLSGTLTLDAKGDPNAVWIFQAGSTLITASHSKVDLINGAQACHVFWQVGSSATIGTYSDFAGTILALEDITVNTGATVYGRLLAGANQTSGAVTLDNNTITVPICVPEANSFWSGAFCASIFAWQGLVVWRRKTARS